MNKKRLFFAFLLILLFVGTVEFLILLYKKEVQQASTETKRAAVTLTGLPDLALSTEARYIRHRSLATLGSVFNEEGTLAEYFPSAFAYTLPGYVNADARIAREP